MPLFFGEVAEWSKALVLKTSDGLSRPRVQIPASPPFILLDNMFNGFAARSLSRQRIKNIFDFIYVETSKTSKTPSLLYYFDHHRDMSGVISITNHNVHHHLICTPKVENS